MAVVLEPGIQISLAEVTRALVGDGLPKYKLPEELVFWDEPLPVNPNGKVDRTKLDALSVGRQRMLADRLATTG
jgi:non-ribosomal peptide synthetase component E (peptide arylation enzyme)